MANTVILACSSFARYIRAAQEKAGTQIPVIWLNQIYHRDPKEMREQVTKALSELKPDVKTVLVCMGYCGGSWREVKTPVRTVFPRVDDCVSCALTRPGVRGYALKQSGHLYVKNPNPRNESFKGIFERLTAGESPEKIEEQHKLWCSMFESIDIVDTGVLDIRDPEYIKPVCEDAVFLDAEVDVVPGSNLVVEKLISGDWDEHFVIFAPGETITEERLRNNQ